MTWRWKAFSMRLTPTSPSRTSSELRREGIRPVSSPDDVRPGDPVLQAALLAVEAHPQEPEEQRRDAREVASAARHAARRRRTIAVDIDNLHVKRPHAEGLPDHDVEDEQVHQ